jgi:hypothetical protein
MTATTAVNLLHVMHSWPLDLCCAAGRSRIIFGGAGAGVATRCGPTGSERDVQHKNILKEGTICNNFVPFPFTFTTIPIKKNKRKESLNPYVFKSLIKLTFGKE